MLWLRNLCTVGEGEGRIFISPGLPVVLQGMCTSALMDRLSDRGILAPAPRAAVHP